MAKRKSVPAALHSELSGYTALIRALRTRDTLDITSQLTRAVEPTQVAIASGSNSPSKPRKDIWDRWPIFLEELSIPEWGLKEEVKHIATHAPKQQLPRGQSSMTDEEDDGEDEMAVIEDALLLDANTHLSAMLAHISAHVPVTSRSMQDRFDPINWTMVLEIMSKSGLMDEQFVLDSLNSEFSEVLT